LNISSQERPIGSPFIQDRNGLPLYNRTSNLNRSHIGPKQTDEWDCLIINDVKKFEEEQRQTILKQQKMKRQIMDDLNAQMQEKRKLMKRELEEERELEQKRLNINKTQDKHLRQLELKRSRKNEEERKIMETQIAEMEKIKQFEKDNDNLLAIKEKQQVDRALQDDISREQRKKKEYQEVCKKQYQDNIELKEIMKKQEAQRRKDEVVRKKDMFGDMFEEKKHISYDYAAKNQRKFEALNKILNEENDRKDRARNYAEFEEGVNSLERRQKHDQELKDNRLKERLKNNRMYLEEQIQFKKSQNRFEKDIEQTQAIQMNRKAEEELEREAKRNQEQRKKRVQHNKELKTQMIFKDEPLHGMTEQEKRMNKDKLQEFK
jgi:colicin import membrane protein